MKKFFRFGGSKKEKGLDASSQGKASTQSLDQTVNIGYDIKEKSLNKFHKAAWTGDIEKVKQLVKKEGNPGDKEKRTPLHLASCRGHTEIVEILLEWTKKVDVCDNQKKTPLLKAVETGHEECARLLLNCGADPNLEDLNGDTCLHFAVRRGDEDIIDLLISHKDINPNAFNKVGVTPLHETVFHKHAKFCGLLVDEGANINCKDRDGNTPLMYACHLGQPDTVRDLLQLGASKNVKNKNGYTADDMSQMAGNEACRKVLSEFPDNEEEEDEETEASSAVSPRRPPTATAQPATQSDTEEASPPGPKLIQAKPIHGDSDEDEDDDEDDVVAVKPRGDADEVVTALDDSWRDSSEDESHRQQTPVKKTQNAVVHSPSDEGPSSNKNSAKQSFQPDDGDDWSDEDESLFSSAAGAKPGHKPAGAVYLLQLQQQKEEEKKQEQAQKQQQQQRALQSDDNDWGDDTSLGLSARDKPKAPSLQQGLAGLQQANTANEKVPATKQMKQREKNAVLAMSDISDVSDVELSDNEAATTKPVTTKTTVTKPPPLSATSRQSSNWDSDEEEEEEEGAGGEKTAVQGATAGAEVDSAVTPRKDDNSNWDSDSEFTPSPTKDGQAAGANVAGVIDSVVAVNKPDVITEDSSRPAETKKAVAVKKDEDDEEDSKWDSDDSDGPVEGAVNTQAFLTEPPAEPPRPKPALVTQGSMMGAESEEEEEEEEEEESTWEKERKLEKESKKQEEYAKKAQAARALLEEISYAEDENDGVPEPSPKAVESSPKPDVEDEARRKQWEREWEQNQEQLRREAAEEIRRERDLEKRQSMESLDELDIGPQPSQGKEVTKSVDNFQTTTSIKDQPPQIEDDFSDEDDNYLSPIRGHQPPANPLKRAQKESASLQAPALGRKSERVEPIRPQLSHGGMDVSFDTDDDMEEMTSMTVSPRKHEILASRKDDDDDRLSYTDTEHDDNDTSVHESRVAAVSVAKTSAAPANTSQHSHVASHNHINSAKNDVSSASMAGSESANVMRLHEQFRDSQRKLDRERSMRVTLETRRTALEQERAELVQKLEDLTRAKSALEKGKIELDARVRSLEYSLRDEQEKRANAELLHTKCREQLERKEEQYTGEIEAKQKSELAMRNLQIEFRTARTALKQLEEEKDDLARQLNHERDSRALQEKINEEQHVFNRSLTAAPEASESAEARARLESLDDSERARLQGVEQLRAELGAVKAELERQRARHKDEHDLMLAENEDAHRRIQSLKEDLMSREHALSEAVMKDTVEISTLRTEYNKLQSRLSASQAEVDKLKAELESLNKRLDGKSTELEREQKARSELERASQRDREEWRRQLDRAENEQSQLKFTQQSSQSRLAEAENRAARVEQDLAVANATLVERTSQLTTIQREMDQRAESYRDNDQALAKEKEETTRLTVRCETLQERLTSLQHELLGLRSQLDEARLAGAKGESSESLNQVLAQLRADQEKTQAALQDKNASLNETVVHLKEELRNVDNRRVSVESELRTAQSELAETHRQLSVAQASLEVNNKGKEQAESERARLRGELDAAQQRLAESREKELEAQRRVSDLKEKAERAERQAEQQARQLSEHNANMAAMQGNKSEAVERTHRLEMEKTRLESALQHESERVQQLQRQLADSQQIRTTLEALLGNYKSNNAHLEDKLCATSAGKNLASYEAEDAKQMWESEVKSRSKLGLKIAEMERAQQQHQTVLEEEKRKTRKALELKKAAEVKLEEEKQKTAQLQQEVTTLRNYVRAAKKRLKELDLPENAYNALQASFAQERNERDRILNDLRLRANTLQEQLDSELENKSKIECECRKLKQDLATQASERRIQRAKQKLRFSNPNTPAGSTAGSSAGGGQVPATAAELDRTRQSQQELSLTLAGVNAFLEDHATHRQALDRMREEHEAELRREFEKNKRELLEELSRVRADQQKVLSEKELHEREAKRLQNLYDNEVRLREHLLHRLDKTSNTQYIMPGGHYPPTSTASPGGTAPMDGSYMLNNQWSVSKRSHGVNDLSARIRQELDRSIAKHLEKGPHIDISVPARSSLDDHSISLSAFNKSRSDYLATLQRNYFV